MPVRTAIFAIVATLGFSSVTLAQSDERAEKLNDEGKRLFGEQKLEEALAKFRQAVVVAPEGKYYFNVCFTLSQLKRTKEAVTACEAVAPNGADEKLLGKTNKLLESLRAQLPPPTDTGGSTTADDGGQPTGTGPTGTGPTGTGTAPPPPPMGVEQAAPPIRHGYEWALGAELMGVSNLSMGEPDIDDTHYDDGGGIRLFGTMMLDRARRLGGQAYLSYSRLPNSFEDLSIVDLGVAGLWHFPVARSLYVTPLVGAHVSLQGPAESSELFLAVGARASVSLDWVLGTSGRHALSLSLGTNVYSRAGGNSNGLEPADYALDKGGATAIFGLGYTLRFQTPLGQLPVITLE